MVDCTKPIAESNNFIILDKYSPDWKISESYQSEGDLERELIQDLVNQGYEYLPALTIPRICWLISGNSCKPLTM